MKTSYFYKDSEGKEHKYVGKIQNKNNECFGNIISTIEKYSISELKQVKEYVKSESISTYLVYNDRYGKENILTDDDYVSNNQVIKKIENKFDIIYHPPVEEQIEFFIKGTKKKFEGEIIENDGKFFYKA